VALENVVLVAALAWLKGQRGKTASVEERTSVMAAVRLPLLRPHLISLLQDAWTARTAEFQELLPEDNVEQLGYYLSVGSKKRAALLAATPKLQHWGKERRWQAVEVVCKGHIDQQTLQIPSTEPDTAASRWHMPRVDVFYLDGLYAKAFFFLWRDEGSTTEYNLYISLFAEPEINGSLWGVSLQEYSGSPIAFNCRLDVEAAGFEKKTVFRTVSFFNCSVSGIKTWASMSPVPVLRGIRLDHPLSVYYAAEATRKACAVKMAVRIIEPGG
jgi:hypothetical protein